MADEKVRTVFEGDASSFESAVQKVKRGADDTKKSAESIGQSMQGLNSAFELAKKGAEAAGRAFDFVAKNGATEAFNRSLSAIQKSNEELYRSIAESVTQSTAFNQAMDQVAKGLDEAKSFVDKFGVSIGDTLAGAFQLARIPIIAFNTAVGIVQGSLATFAAGLGVVLSNLRPISSTAGDAGDALLDFAGANMTMASDRMGDAAAQAEKLKAGLQGVADVAGKSLGSRRAAPLGGPAGKPQIDEEFEAFQRDMDKRAAIFSKVEDVEAANTQSRIDDIELVFSRNMASLSRSLLSEEEYNRAAAAFRKERGLAIAEYINADLEKQSAVWAEEEKRNAEHNKRMADARAMLSERTAEIMKNAQASEEQRQIRNINNASQITSAAFQAGQIWAEAFKKGASGRDIARGIFSTLALGLGVAGTIVGGPVGAGLTLGAVGASGVGGLLSSFHSGGIVRAHSGLAISPLLPGEVDIRAQTDERVLSRSQVSQLGGQEGVDRAIQAGGPGYHFTFAPVISPGVNAAEVRGILRKEMVEFQGQFTQELRRTGAIRKGVR